MTEHQTPDDIERVIRDADLDAEPPNDADMVLLTARARHVAGAIQNAVAARPELASSIYGVGLDALTSALAADPMRVMEAGPWLVLIVACYNYIADGRDPDGLVANLAAGSLPIGAI